jgi:hypothetical protein
MENRYKNYETLINKKYSSYEWSISNPEDYNTLEWSAENSIPKPTKEFLDGKLAAAKGSYAQHREKYYPDLKSQLDMLWHAMDQDIIPGKDTSWYTTIKEIKDTFPKP